MKYILPLHLKPKPFNQSEKNLSHSFLRGQKSSALACHKTVFLVHIDSKHNIEPLLDWGTYQRVEAISFPSLDPDPFSNISFPSGGGCDHGAGDMVTMLKSDSKSTGTSPGIWTAFFVKDLPVLTLDDSGLQTWLWLCPRGSGLKDFSVCPSPFWLLRVGVELKNSFLWIWFWKWLWRWELRGHFSVGSM